MTPPWFVPLEERADATATLFVFPHAGGGPASLIDLTPKIPGAIEPWAVNLPGRQARLPETPRTDLRPLVDELAEDLAGRARAPQALFGYCSGAMLAYLVCRRLGELGRPPARLYVGSFAAPDVALLLRRLPTLPSEIFWEQIIELGGLPRELADRVALRPVLEPALRADFGLLAGYHHEPGPPMTTPITVLYGRDDHSLSRGSLLGWRRQSAHRLSMRELPATHWLVDDAPDELVAAIAEEI
ncbi:thioesterase II family protein [Rhizohabitans arisaemae]|uniref:thioesterase II family protein n=1 Tax=Rhizohabitans arisaemae TaxID=2720610 RepID=UPI0024B07FA7|nr:alpha/beta fold hydrolase [Rhizohabitans arisaemae]